MSGHEDLAALLADIEREAAAHTRFPVRFVLVSGTQAWGKLVPLLRARASVTIELSALCEGEDVLPYLQHILPRLRQAAASNVLILPLAEALRLQPDQAGLLDRLAEFERPGQQRVYVPLLEAGDLFEATVAQLGRYRSGDVHPGWRLSGKGEARVDAAAAAPGWLGHDAIQGLRAYFQHWEHGAIGDSFVVTSMARFLTSRAGMVELIVHRSPYSLARSTIGGVDTVPEDWGTDERWRWLVAQAQNGETLPALAARQLNAATYDAERLFPQWRYLSGEQQWLLWVWSKLEAHRDTYYGLVAEESGSESEVPALAATVAIGRSLSTGLLRQRLRMLVDLGMDDMPPEFWKMLGSLSDPLARLHALPGLSERERCEIVAAVGELLHRGVDERAWLPLVDLSYPELASYLTSYPYTDSEVEQYFRLYTRSRVCDHPLPALMSMAADLAERQALWRFPTRGSQLGQEQVSQWPVQWFDAMGIEWAGVLRDIFERAGCEVHVEVCRANLPTTTAFNDEWKDGSPPRQLDQEAHSYDYRHPRSLVREIGFVSGFARQVRSAAHFSSVVMTSDHGLTRFAPAGPRVEVPTGGQVGHRGRYADLPAGVGAAATADAPYLVYDGRAILAVHGLFSGGVGTTGEVHGGATFEESLVPMILVAPRSGVAELSLTLVTDIVRLNARGQGELTIEANRALDDLRLVLPRTNIVGVSEDSRRWRFALTGIPTGKLRARLESAGQTVGEVEWQAQRGIVQDDLGL